MATVGDRFAMRLLVLAEQQRHALDHLEHDEQDPERLHKLYEIDHAVTLMRRAARELRVLSEKGEPEMGGVDTSLVDIVRMAASSIESYSRVQVGPVAELAVLGYAADDVASLLAPLMDNATRYSPTTVSVSAHTTESGGVVVRVVDAGIGLQEGQARALNATMAAAVPAVDEHTSKHTGFPVVHRLARRHNIQVHFVSRASGAPGSSGSGTTAVVSLPPQLICEAPGQSPALGDIGGSGAPAPSSDPPASAPVPRPPTPKIAPGPIGADSAPPPEPPPPERPAAGTLPRRERGSLRERKRGDEDGGSQRPRRPLAAESDPSNNGPASGWSFADDLDSLTFDAPPDPTSQSPENRPEN
ncbi:ATP-binding protein [Halostreptopolyspora alba]|uniref:histidine kinase n=1 Tax=Halostreptopolyspora alba TaxID=2487137 RepID=A0A3N0EE97_9ACTN|nr:hypothetical protein EFW17_06485 [Nocardiopsaceae bacterium YIM 96095]